MSRDVKNLHIHRSDRHAVWRADESRRAAGVGAVSGHAGGLQFGYGDGSVRMSMQRRPVSLSEVATALRNAGGVSRAYALGKPGTALLAAQAQLRLHGVATGLPSPRPIAGELPALLLMTRGGPGLLLLGLTDGPATPLLLPAVQSARESARRIETKDELEVVLVLRAPGATAASVPHESMALNFQRIRY